MDDETTDRYVNEGAMVFELTVPTAWPPRLDVCLFAGCLDGAKLSAVAGRDARIRFSCVQNARTHTFTTPPLDIPDYAGLKVAFTWGGGDPPRAAINGTLFTDALVRAGKRVTLKSVDQVSTGLRERRRFQALVKPTREEERLVRSVAELQDRIARPDPVNLLEASVILRRLLLDARPLIHLVNRQYRHRLLFPAVLGKSAAKPSDDAAYTFICLTPRFAAPEEIESLPLNDFLAQTVVEGERSSYSVRDVIDVCANTKGGIHFGEPRSDTQKALLDLDQRFLPAFIDVSLHALADLSWSVIHGLSPLISEIEQRRCL